jgi:small subunit ribosomal protein S4
MGDIKKIRKKFQRPSHPWQKDRILHENALVKEYGLKNKSEVWKLISLLANFKKSAKESISSSSKQHQLVAEQLLQRLRSIGLLSQTSLLNDVLTLTEKDVMERRLQTILYRKGFARSVNQARQLITHCHVKVDGRKISSPSYIVKKNEEDKITYADNSSLFAPEHPERAKIAMAPSKKSAAKKERAANAEKANAEGRSRGQFKRRPQRPQRTDRRDAPHANKK